MKKILLIVFLMFSMSTHIDLYAQDLKIKIEAPERVSIDEYFEVRLLTNKKVAELERPSFTNFDTYSIGAGAIQRSSGTISSDTDTLYFIGYKIRPKHLGNNIIEPWKVAYNGNEFKSPNFAIDIVSAIQMQHERDSINYVKKNEEMSMIRTHVEKLERQEDIEAVKKIDDYIWTPQLLINIKKSNPARYKTMLNDKRLLIYGKITHITEETKYLGYLSKVVYNIILNSDIIVEVESAEEVSKYSIGDNIYTLIETADETKYAESLPVFYPVLKERTSHTSIDGIVEGMKLQREIDFNNPSKYVTSSQIWYGKNPDKMNPIELYNQFLYNNLYIQYLLKIPTK